MTIGNILESLILGPLTLLFEWIFVIANKLVNNPGLSIVALSLIMNILVLPLYKRADDMQEEARQVEEKLQKGVAHIKKHFSGDEWMMILQAYYSENNYKPTDALKGTVSLLLQIPFFMAAYNFLSNLAVLQGASLGPIENLGVPDGLLVIGGLSINLLPILMTLVNVISSAIYLKGFPLKTKIQIYGMALFFLVFLYNSPAGLVFYWTLNNVFSLGKTIYYKLNVPKVVLKISISLAGVAVVAFGILGYHGAMRYKVLLLAAGAVLAVAPLLPKLFGGLKKRLPKHEPQPNKGLFMAGSVFLTLLVGVLISTTYIAASPQEFVDVTYFYHPLWYVLNTLCVAAGTFLIWLRVFYWLATPKAKIAFEWGVWIASGIMLADYLFFGLNLGNLSASLRFDSNMNFGMEKYLNLTVICAVAVVFYFIVRKWGKAVTGILIVVSIAIGAMSLKNVYDIKTSIDNVTPDDGTTAIQFQLDTQGQNVVVIMLDRAVGEYIPYILNEKPELKEQFDGFTYYANTISYSDHTNFCVPSLMGGYEYTPVELNKADTRPLVEKHNEALKVMPVLFEQNGYDVTVIEPIYANYNWISDLSIYDEYEGISAYNVSGRFDSEEQKQWFVQANYRNFFCFSLMKCLPVALQPVLYNGGNYLVTPKVNQAVMAHQTMMGLSAAAGYDNNFMSEYNVLSNMTTMTNITNNGTGSFMVMTNQITHNEQLLQTPDYTPADVVDNREYDAEHADRFTLEDGSTLDVTTDRHIKSYHSHVAALMQIGEWLDYLKESGVYDNTRIILTSDHGNAFFQSDALAFDEEPFKSNVSAEDYFPLLMVKDFDSEGFEVSYEFMTNADVPTLATAGVIENPINPFTGKPINSDEKTAHDQYILVSTAWDISTNNGNSFKPGYWISITDDLWDKEDWEFYHEQVVLKEHAFPE